MYLREVKRCIALVVAGSGLAVGCGANAGVTDLTDSVKIVLPEGSIHTDGQGIDSSIGTITGENFGCQYDIGAYSTEIDESQAEVSESTDVSGRTARLVSGPAGFDGLHVPGIATSAIGEIRMSMTCTSYTDAAREQVRQMLRSVHIKDEQG